MTTDPDTPSPEAKDQPPAKTSVVVVGTVCLLWLMQLYGLLFFGTSQYFSFTDLAVARIHDIHVTGAIARLFLPVVVGFGIAKFSKGSPLREATSSGFFASFLICWPGIYFPPLREDLVGSALANEPGKLLAIYGFFMLSYSLLARVGAIAGLYYPRLRAQNNLTLFWSKVSKKDVLWTVAIGLLTNVIWEIAVRIAK